MDPGLVSIEGKLVKGVATADAEKAIEVELGKMKAELVSDTELQKVKNKTESIIAFEDMSVMSRANSLAFYELTGNAELINEELGKYQQVTAEEIRDYSRKIFDAGNSNTLYYNSKN
jgi:predicted Zn-dependent peptidase